ncbi:ester cyclase [Streptomyces sp. NPDC007084]|uniref:ester cyclase n=1 Tax=Streptomyces sp. NPDC007084 TaxID=3154313 RepID=UPI003452EDCE
MSTEDNKRAFVRIVRDVINAGDTELARELFDENFTVRRGGLQTTAKLLTSETTAITGEGMSSLDGFIRGLASMRRAFSDFNLDIDESSLVAEGDQVAGIWKLDAVHNGPFFGIEATGARVVMEEAGIMRFADGKLVEGWFLVDELGFLAALGAVKVDAGVSS